MRIRRWLNYAAKKQKEVKGIVPSKRQNSVDYLFRKGVERAPYPSINGTGNDSCITQNDTQAEVAEPNSNNVYSICHDYHRIHYSGRGNENITLADEEFIDEDSKDSETEIGEGNNSDIFSVEGGYSAHLPRHIMKAYHMPFDESVKDLDRATG